METTLRNRSDKSISMARYEVYDTNNNRHLGWVTRFDQTWTAHISAHVNNHTEGVASQLAASSIKLAGDFSTRREAIDEITIDLECRYMYRRSL